MRLAVFLDYRVRRTGDTVSAERAFALFVYALARRLGGLVLIGRADPGHEPFPYVAPAEVTLAQLPFYPSLTQPLRAAPALAAGVRRLWGMLDGLDAVWVLGPNPLGVVLAFFGLLRGRRVVLGIRQETRQYVVSRHPGRRMMLWAAVAMDAAFRILAKRCPTVVVGDEIAKDYAHAPMLHRLVVSLVSEADIRAAHPERESAFSGRLLAVGRLDAEKNPLLLADILARLVAVDPERDWRLDVVGDGPLAHALEERLDELGVGDRAVLHGYVAFDGGLLELYRDADVFLHVSWTEGVPQVLVEAFAQRLPVLATDVGGVASLVGDAALLMPAGDPEAAVSALRRMAGDADLRSRLRDAGTGVARDRSLEHEVEQLAAFLAGTA